MRLGGVAGVPDLAEQLAGRHPVADRDRDRAGAEVRQMHEFAPGVDAQVVAGRGSVSDPAHRLARHSVDRRDDYAVTGGEDAGAVGPVVAVGVMVAVGAFVRCRVGPDEIDGSALLLGHGVVVDQPPRRRG